MARMRTLKPQFFLNEGLAEIEPLGRLLFQGLWCLADREGRLEDRPRRIKAEALPYDDADVDGLLDQLYEGGFIQRYEVNGVRYILISTFTKHQSPHCKEAESIIPAPGEHHASTAPASDEPDAGIGQAPPVPVTVPETVPDPRVPRVDTFGGETPRERMAPVASAAPMLGTLAFVSPSPVAHSAHIVPPKPVQPSAPVTVPAAIPKRSARARDLLWDACVDALDGAGPSNDAERGKWNKGLKALRQSGATPEEIAIRAERYKRRFGESIPLNPMALAGNWTILATEVHDHDARAGNGANGGGSSARWRGGTSRSRSTYTGQHLPDADEWAAYAKKLERAGHLAKPRQGDGDVPVV